MPTPILIDPAADAASIMLPDTAPVPVIPVQPKTATGPVERGQPLSAFRPGFHRSNPDGSPYRNRYGNFMPRGGRRALSVVQPKTETVPVSEPKTVLSTAESSPAPATGVTAPKENVPVAEAVPPSAATEPVQKTAPQPSVAAWSDAERAAAAKPAESVASPASASSAEVYDSSDDAAEVIALAIFFLIGILFGAPEEATPADGEQKRLIKITAALIRTTGWKGSAWWAAGLSWAAYVLRFLRKPKAAARVQGWVDELRGMARPVAPPPAAAPVVPKPSEQTFSATPVHDVKLAPIYRGPTPEVLVERSVT